MKKFIKYRIYTVIYLILAFIAVFNALGFHKKAESDRRLFPAPVKTELTVKVLSVPSYKNDRVTFTAKPTSEKRLKCFTDVSLNYARNAEIFIGDTLTLTGTLKHPASPMNSFGYDSSQYIESRGSSLVFESDICNIKNTVPGSLRPIYRLRNKITDKILFSMPPDEAGLVIALITGDKSLLSSQTKDAFRTAGIYHIIAVSGLHLNLIIMFITISLAASAFRKKTKWIMTLIFTALACVLMFVFTGFGVSVERAAFMSVMCSAAVIFMREYSPEASLFAVGIIILLTEPYSISDASFLLSFSATAGVLAGVRLIKKLHISERKFAFIMESIIISISTSVFTLPFTVRIFKGFSAVVVLSNLIILPIIPLLLGMSYILGILCIFLPAEAIRICAFAVTVPAYTVNIIAKAVTYIPHAYISISETLFTLIFVNVSAAVAAYVFRKKKTTVILLLIITVANICNLTYNITNDTTKVIFFNAGQGESSLIHTESGSTIMIDCGSENYEMFGNSEIITCLDNMGVQKLDALFVTHFHSDHANGIAALMENGYVRRLFVPDRSYAKDERQLSAEIINMAVKKHIPVEFISENCIIDIDNDHTFKILNPDSKTVSDANNASFVTEYIHNGNTILYMGDAGPKALLRLTDTLPQCDIIKLAHHGSEISFNNRIAERTKPKYTVISCGKDNMYGHPAQATLKAYSKSEILRTDKEESEIVFLLKNNEIKRRKYNAQHKK